MKFGLSILLVAVFLLQVLKTSYAGRGVACEKRKLFTEQHVSAWSAPSHIIAFFFKSGLAIDADGAFRAYHPNDRLGLDSLAHAGHPGNWWALVTHNGKTSGHPVVQQRSDPAPGYYVSTTALYDPDNPNQSDPHRYVDAATVPYIALHPKALKYARLGDFATVVNLQNQKVSAALVADETARNLSVGEGSIALAEALGVNSDPRYGGKDGAIVYLIYPSSGNGKPRRVEDIVANSNRLFEMWGGLAKLTACLASE
jgi:Fungal chitosanase of glycosyl hydrolase group 75